MSRWVITDIHGCFNTFKHLLEEKVKLTEKDELYLLGDYINKGPFSKEVLDYLIQLKQSNLNVHISRGNHEQEFLNLLLDATTLDAFLEKGGNTFLKSFDVEHPADIPQEYIEFFKGMDWYFSLPDFLLVHAGFDFSKKKPFTICEDILNIRDYKVDLKKSDNRRVLHGHTPTNLKKIVKRLNKNKKKHMSLDAGCPYRSNPKQGSLLALNLDDWNWLVQENIDDSSNYSE